MQPLKARPDPAPSRLSYRLQRLMLTPLFRRVLRVGVPFGLAFAAAWTYLDQPGRQQAIVLAIADMRQQIETRPEFMVRLLALEGASASVEDDIREIFPYDLPASSFDIDLDLVRDLVAGLPAVADADLRIRRGGGLTVRVNERQPVAVWRTRDGFGVVDRQGYAVADLASRDARPDLPLIAGEGGDADVPGALDILSAAAPLGNRVLGLVRIGERRWDVVLDRGQRILLPEQEPVRALERVIVLGEVQDMLERDVAAIDMRLPGRATVRMNAHAVEEWWRVTMMTAGGQRQ